MKSSYRTLLKKYRKQAGMTQGELAEKVGVKLSKISHLETGYTDLTVDLAVNLAEALSISPSKLLGWENSLTKDQIEKQQKADDFIRQDKIDDLIRKIDKVIDDYKSE